MLVDWLALTRRYRTPHGRHRGKCRAPALRAGSVSRMSTSPYSSQQKFAVSAGTAFKFGFFGALGVFVFYLAVSIVLTVIGLVLLATGVLGNLPSLQRLLGN